MIQVNIRLVRNLASPLAGSYAPAGSQGCSRLCEGATTCPGRFILALV